jgi:ribonuclease HI
MSDSAVIEAQTLPAGTTSQKAELITLARALTLARDKMVNIYTDSKYAFHTLLLHSAIWKERGFLHTKGTPIVNDSLITQVLEVSCLPSRLGITHCKAHQTDSSFVTWGNNRAYAAPSGQPSNPHLSLSYSLLSQTHYPLNFPFPLLR